MPLIPAAVRPLVTDVQTVDTISTLVEKTQGRVKRMREANTAAAQAAVDFAEYEEARSHIRKGTRKLADFDRINAAIISAHETKKAVPQDKWNVAEEKMVCAYSNLHVRHLAYLKQKKITVQAAKVAKKQQRTAALQAKRAAIAADKAAKEAEKKAAAEKEEQLKMKRRDNYAAMSLELKEKALAATESDKVAAERQAAIDVEFLKLLRNFNEEQARKKGSKRKRSARMSESESEKENVEPTDE